MLGFFKLIYGLCILLQRGADGIFGFIAGPMRYPDGILALRPFEAVALPQTAPCVGRHRYRWHIRRATLFPHIDQ